MLNERVANAIIIIVTLVWAVNFGARFVVPEYESSESINAIFMAIVGGVFALKGRGDAGGDERNKSGKSSGDGEAEDHG